MTPKAKAKSKSYKSEAHRLAHPFQDATADWLRENDAALVELRGQQAEQNLDIARIRSRYAQQWLNYTQDNHAPKTVQKSAAINLAAAERNEREWEQKQIVG